MTCEVISEPQAAASLRDHGFCRCQWRTWQRPSTAVLGGAAKRLLMAFHMFSVSLFHVPTAPNTETETVWMELFNLGSVYTFSEGIWSMAMCMGRSSDRWAMEMFNEFDQERARNYNSCGGFHQTTISVKTANFQFEKAKDLLG